MRVFGWLLVATVAWGQLQATEPPPPSAPRIVGTVSEIMIDLIYPTSDAILYVETRAPKNDVEWNELRAKALTLTEAANLLMMPGRARDQDQWKADATLMLNAGAAAFRAAKNKDLPALIALNNQVYESCTTCHAHYRQSYGRGRTPPPAR